MTAYNAKKVSKAGRYQRMIENESFNALKNQGCRFGHNFGHGHDHLCTNFALPMMLAFLIDQVQRLCNGLFNEASGKAKWKRYLWEDIRTLPFGSMEMIYKAIVLVLKWSSWPWRKTPDGTWPGFGHLLHIMGKSQNPSKRHFWDLCLQHLKRDDTEHEFGGDAGILPGLGLFWMAIGLKQFFPPENQLAFFI